MSRILIIILCAMFLKSCIIAVTDPDKPVRSTAGQNKDDYSINPVEVAQALCLQGNLSEAERILKQFLRNKPANWQPVVETEDAITCAFWSMEEFVYYIAYRKQSANPAKKIEWSAAPSYSRAYYLLAFISVEQKDWNTAMRYINAGLSLEPDHPYMIAEKGNILIQQGLYVEAYDAFVSALTARPWATAPQKARALRGTGYILIDLKLYDEAEKIFVKSLELEPDNKAALHELSYIRELRGQEYKKESF